MSMRMAHARSKGQTSNISQAKGERRIPRRRLVDDNASAGHGGTTDMRSTRAAAQAFPQRRHLRACVIPLPDPASMNRAVPAWSSSPERAWPPRGSRLPTALNARARSAGQLGRGELRLDPARDRLGVGEVELDLDAVRIMHEQLIDPLIADHALLER